MKDKQEIRRAFLARRRALSPSYRQAASGEMCRILEALPAFRKAPLVLGYCAVKEEVDLTPLWVCALQQGKRVAFPRCVGRKIRFSCVNSLSDLVIAEYGIPAPPADADVLEDFSEAFVVTPALTADENGTRLGYGGGFYDRFLADNTVRDTLCPVYAELFSQTPLLREAFDVPVSTVITEHGVVLK